MFGATDIREWRGHDVMDAEGHKIGELAAIYVDTRRYPPEVAAGDAVSERLECPR